MRRRNVTLMLTFASVVLCASGQTTGEVHRDLLLGTKARVADLSSAFRPPGNKAAELEPSAQARSHAISQIQSEVDAYFAQVDPQHFELKSFEQDLRAILAPFDVEAEYGDPPSSFALDRNGERFLLIAYVLGTGVHGIRTAGWLGGSAITIRAYRAVNGGFGLVDSAGSDMDGCRLFVRELHSPVPNETWLLAWGGVTGSNGPGIYLVRAYAFDGTKFRTVWAPANASGVTATVTADGFAIQHVDREHSIPPGWDFVRDDYTLSPDGPRLVLSSPVY
jgi:hypothetical protein